VASPCQDLPSQISVASGWLARTRSPVTPTAMHSDIVRQETPASPVATGGRLNVGRAPPACTGYRRAPFPVPADPVAGAAVLNAARSAPQPTAAIAFRPCAARFPTTRITLTRILSRRATGQSPGQGSPLDRYLSDAPRTRRVHRRGSSARG